MKVKDWLLKATKRLEDSGIGTARLDALVLLEDATNKSRASLLANPDFEIPTTQLKKMEKQLDQREGHIPLAQIRGKTEFYGREFIITSAVLEPRPESETMIDQMKKLNLPGRVIIADIGTGSGALGITAAFEIPDSVIILSDIDKETLVVAQKNLTKHRVKAQIFNTDLLDNLPGCDVVLANLPYVPDNYEINQAALNEPKIAIFGGEDGLDLYRRLFVQISERARKPTYVLTESLPFQHKKLAEIANKSGYKQLSAEDFIQIFTASPEAIKP